MTVEMLTTAARETADGTRHLIHRPASWDHYLLDAPGGGEQSFVVAGLLPAGRPPAGEASGGTSGEASGHFHDPWHVAAEVGEVGAFLGREYFGVPADRPGRFSRLALSLTDVPAWRAAPGTRPRLTTYLTARPQSGAGRAPRGLELDVAVRIGDVPCCTGGADLDFPPAAPQRGRIGHGRRALRTAGPREVPAEGPGRPVDPAEVGRRSPGGVLLTDPAVSAQGRLTTRVRLPACREQTGGTAADGVLLEVLRQASVLTAGRARGYDAGLALLTDWDVRFRGGAAPGLPLRCVALPGRLDKDPDGRPRLPVALTLTQLHRTVATARTRVVQDL